MRRKATPILALGGLVALLAAFWLLLERPAEPPPAPPAPPSVVEAEPEPEPKPGAVVPERVAVADAEGRVEIQRGADGPWAPLAPGDQLDLDDAVRTGPNGRVGLVAGDHVVHLLPGTDVRVKELTADLSRFLLGTGMIAAAADAPEGVPARTLQIEVEGTDAVARAEDGRFRMSSNGEGVVAVGAQEGEVRVAARGREVVLKAGEGTLVAGGAPAEPVKLERSLLLKVAWPDERATNRREITVTGRTRAGSLVFVAGRPAKVDEKGRFSAPVRLREGSNRVPVAAFDVGGHEVVRRGPRILVDTKGAKARFDTEDLWGE